jgi:GGDEF domain-containing protein
METKNKKSGSPSAGGSVIAALCIIIYLFALVQGAVRIYLSMDERKSTVEQEFYGIADIALSAGIQGFMDERFVNAINEAFEKSKSLEAIIITGPNGGNAFEKRPAGHAITWVNNEPRFINKFYFLQENLYRPLVLPDVRNANIKAVANAFDFTESAKIMKETLLIILIGFALSFFTFFLQSLMGKNKTETVYIKTPESARSVSVKNDDHDFSSAGGPNGLYSPRTGLGWEEYTRERLDSELHRCSSTENDLTLLLMEFTDAIEERIFIQAAKEASSFFAGKDLIFEHGEMGFAVILPGAGFEAAIAKSEKFYQRMMKRFPNSYMKACGLCIGLSSRSGRLLNTDRLILEASEALKKAKSDTKTKIIAFKSDLEKYRAFIASQN